MRRWFTALAAVWAALTGAAQEYGVVDISVCNLRATPDYDAEMVSQALLGTPVHILQLADKNNWPQVQTPDTYTGWVHKDAITLLSFEEYHAWNTAPKIVVTALTGVVYEKPSPRSATVSDVVAGTTASVFRTDASAIWTRSWASPRPPGAPRWTRAWTPSSPAH